MKYYIFYAFLAFLSVTTFNLAQTGDSANSNNQPVSNSTRGQTKTTDPSTVKMNQTVVTQTTGGNKTIQDIISFLPVAFFIFIVSMIFIKLRKDGVKLSEILIDKETVLEKRKTDVSIAASHAQVATAAAAAITANPNASLPADTFTPPAAASVSQTQDNPEQSTSRLIVFICGITSIALACCICTFYFYKSFTGTEKVDLGNLTNVLYGLGLGVLPYGFNKIAAALK